MRCWRAGLEGGAGGRGWRAGSDLFGEVGRSLHVQDGQQAGAVCCQLVVQAELHHHGDGSDLILELLLILRQRQGDGLGPGRAAGPDPNLMLPWVSGPMVSIG